MSFLSSLSNLTKLITKPVGNNVENEEDDVRTIRDSFEEIDVFKDEEKERDYQGKTLGIVTRGLDEKIKGFQRDNNLRVDGLINPGGETEGALSQELKEKRRGLDSAPQIQPVPSRQDGYSLVEGGLRVNKDKVAEGIEKFLTAQVQSLPPQRKSEKLEKGKVKEEPLPERKDPSVEVQAALNEAKSKLKVFDKKGYALSSKFLQHYLGKSGKPLEISTEDIERSNLYRKAIKTNQKRFEDSIVKGVVDRTYEWHGNAASGKKGTPSAFENTILNMKDGETITLNNPDIKNAGDSWDRDIGRLHSIIKDSDHGRSLGAVKLRSLGNLQATRQGNKIEITGKIDHQINDTYNFNDDTLFDKKEFKEYRLLAREGHAKTFKVHGSKKQKITGTLEIKNGRITKPKFKWADSQE